MAYSLNTHFPQTWNGAAMLAGAASPFQLAPDGERHVRQSSGSPRLVWRGGRGGRAC